MKFDIKKETSRDLMALGSPMFILLVLVRVFIADNYLQFTQILLSVILVGGVLLINKRIDFYAASMVILGVFTSTFYNDQIFTFFVILVGIISIIGMKYSLKRKGVFKGAILGIITSVVSYYLTQYFPLANL